MGLLVDEIVDIVDDLVNIEIASNRPGVLGSAVIKGQATEVIDISHFLRSPSVIVSVTPSAATDRGSCY